METKVSPDPQSTQPRRIRPLLTADQDVAGNLPRALTSLIGREAEIAAAGAMLRRDDVRLVTFTGPGGVGKTQLALAVTRALNDAFVNGVVFVPLAPLSEPSFVVSAIAQELNIRDHGSRSAIDAIRSAIGDRELLLLLDNFEHVTAAAPLVVDLLTACPYLKVLVTSRALLQITGERAFDVVPLALPDSTGEPTAEQLARFASVRLFVDRAQAIEPDFHLTDANASDVGRLCRRLNGLPLALELAAARTRLFSPAALVARLDRQLPLLEGGPRDQPIRLRSMRSAIAWSYDLLSPEEQSLFRQVSVFAGGFSLDAAESVAGEGTVELLESLVDQSLVQRIEQPGAEPRFGLLETVREFGLEHLAANEEEADTRARHAMHYLELAEWADRTPITPEKEIADRRLEQELPNLRAALAWAAEQHDVETLTRLAIALGWFWDKRGSLDEARLWLGQAIEATAGAQPRLLGRRALLLALAGDISTWRGATDQAVALLGEGLAAAKEADDPRAIAKVSHALGVLAIFQGDHVLAATQFKEALTRFEALDDAHGVVWASYGLGWTASLRGDRNEAKSWFDAGLDRARSNGWSTLIAFGLETLGTRAREQGNYLQAASLFAEALNLSRDGRDVFTVGNCVRSLGAVAAVVGDAERAARLLGFEEALLELHGFGEQPEAERQWQAQDVARAQKRLSAEEFAAAWAAGRAMPLAQAIDEALEVAREVTSGERTDATSPLPVTRRELDVLRLLVEGLSDKEIAEALGISRRTVSKHVATILAKFNVASRTAAATYATRRGLISSHNEVQPKRADSPRRL
ncbi:MAG: ATP-binding protein [Thermomicrobiales bacterium]